jgi:large subunit ribosomal protein L1
MPVSNENLLKAIKLMRENNPQRKFAQGVDLSINLRDIDPKKPEGRIDVDVALPHEVGKPYKVGVFGDGELAHRARDAGADIVLGRADVEAIQQERKRVKKLADEFHFFLAQADFMVRIGKTLGPVLGPRGKMPKPIPPTTDPRPLIERLKRTLKVRTRDQPTLHAHIGVENMSDEALAANARAVLDAVEHRLEGLSKVRSIHLKTTMGKPVRVEV